MSARVVNALVRAALAAGATVCLALALQSPATRPEVELRLANGALSMSNSLGGAAILTAQDMRPGSSATGSVTIANTGTVWGDFSLSSFDVTDVPGRGGGLLSTALVASVRDMTNPLAPRAVYAGPLGSMPPRTLGSFSPGALRTYQFTVALPTTAAGLNDLQGGSVTVGYKWSAVTPGDSGPPPTTDPPVGQPPTGGTTPPPTGGSTATPPAVDPPPLALTLKGRAKWSARERLGPEVTATCTRTCAIRAAVRVRGTRTTLALKVTSKPMASAAGRSMRFTIAVPRKALRTLRRAVTRHRHISIAVTVKATDTKRLTATARKLIRVTK
jgi:spore coat-associated protein N